MAKLILFLIVLLVALVVIVPVVAYHLFGLPGVAGVLVAAIAGVFGVKHLAGWGLRRAFVTPFLMKGSVLREARVEVHSAAPSEPPAPEADEETGSEGQDAAYDSEDNEDDYVHVPVEWPSWYQVELAITPAPPTGRGFQLWEPGELALAGPDAVSGKGLDDLDDEESAGEIRQVLIFQDGDWQEDEGMKYGGAQRLRLLLGVPEGQQRVRLRYYLEVFGEIDLPAASSPRGTGAEFDAGR